MTRHTIIEHKAKRLKDIQDEVSAILVKSINKHEPFTVTHTYLLHNLVISNNVSHKRWWLDSVFTTMFNQMSRSMLETFYRDCGTHDYMIR